MDENIQKIIDFLNENKAVINNDQKKRLIDLTDYFKSQFKSSVNEFKIAQKELLAQNKNEFDFIEYAQLKITEKIKQLESIIELLENFAPADNK